MNVFKIKDLNDLKEKLKYEKTVSCLIANKNKVDNILKKDYIKHWLLNVYNFPTVLPLKQYASSIVWDKEYSAALICDYFNRKRKRECKHREKEKEKEKEREQGKEKEIETETETDSIFLNPVFNSNLSEEKLKTERIILLNDEFDKMVAFLEEEEKEYFKKRKEVFNEKHEQCNGKRDDVKNRKEERKETREMATSEVEIDKHSSTSSSNKREENEQIITKETALRETLKLIITEKMKLQKIKLTFGYDNMNTVQILRTIFPESEKIIYKFETVGHIAHLNFCDKLDDVKKLIAEIILDKNHNIKTVINKKDILNNIHRTFEIEHLAGEKNYVTLLKEKDVTIKLNYQLVYWNSKLSHERSRIYYAVKKNSIVIDMFGGVGIFSMLLSQKKCLCFSNDINKHAYHYMNENIKLNKRKSILTFNMDARNFVKIFFDKHIYLKNILSLVLHVDKQNLKNVSIGYINMGCPDTEKGNNKKKREEQQEKKATVLISEKEKMMDTTCNRNNINETFDRKQNEANNELQKMEINLSHYDDIHILMNLPADALQFLDVFKEFLKSTKEEVRNIYIHCYYFSSPATHYEYAMKCITVYMSKIPENVEIHEVRAVSPKKSMYCAEFNLKSLIRISETL